MERSRRDGVEMPLPKNWPRRVRSAVIHTIALAHASLTHARSVAANNINARIRLKEEIDRLRNEIFMLQEEVRITDRRLPDPRRWVPSLRNSPAPTARRRGYKDAS